MLHERAIRRRCCSRDFLVLTLIHTTLAAIAVATLYFRQQLVHAKWVDVVRGAFDRYADTFATGMVALAMTLLALVVLGSIATALRIKKLLVAHGMALTLALIAIVFLVVSAFQVSHEAGVWHQRAFVNASSSHSNISSSVDQELRVATHFNALYCDAQRAYVCDHATLTDVLHAGINSIAVVAINVTTVNDSSSSSGNTAVASVACTQFANVSREWQQVCAYCSEHKSFDDYEAVVTWTQHHCRFSTLAAVWCSSVSSPADSASPFSDCRAPLLHAARVWSRGFAIAWTIASVAIALLLAAVALLLRSHTHAGALDLDDVASDTIDVRFFARA